MAATRTPRVPQPTAAITHKNVKLTWIEGRSPVPEGTYEFWEAVQGASGAVFITIAASPSGSHKTWRDKAYPGQLAIDWQKSRVGVSRDISIFGRSTCRIEKGTEPGTYRFIVVPRDMQKVRGTGERPGRAAPPVSPATPEPVLEARDEHLAEDPVYADPPPSAEPVFKNFPTAIEANEAWDKLLDAYAAVRTLMLEIHAYNSENKAAGRNPPQQPDPVPPQQPDPVPLPEPILTTKLKYVKATRNFYHYREVDASGNFVHRDGGALVQGDLYIRRTAVKERPSAITVAVEPTEG